MTSVSVVKHFLVNEKSQACPIFTEHHSIKMAWLHLCLITNESSETKHNNSSLNRELRWLLNSVRFNVQRTQEISTGQLLDHFN